MENEKIANPILNILNSVGDDGYVKSRESTSLEFKETFNFGNIGEYLKVMASFANNQGGYILFGIKDSPRELIGIKKNKFNNIKQEKISDFILDYFAPTIDWEIDIIQFENRWFGYIYVHKAKTKPIICKKTKSNELKNGEIYYRYRAQTRKIEYSELNQLIQEVIQKQRQDYLSLISKIAKIGPNNSAVIDLKEGNIKSINNTITLNSTLLDQINIIKEGRISEDGEKAYKLVGEIDKIEKSEKKILEYRSTNDPNAPRVNLSDEQILQLYPLTHDKLVEKLSKRYNDFHRNREFNKIKKELRKNQQFAYKRYLDPSKPKSSHKYFYSEIIIKEFDKHYSKK